MDRLSGLGSLRSRRIALFYQDHTMTVHNQENEGKRQEGSCEGFTFRSEGFTYASQLPLSNAHTTAELGMLWKGRGLLALI